MQILVWLLCLSLSWCFVPPVSMAQNPEDDEPAFSETPEFREFLQQRHKTWTIDDEIEEVGFIIERMERMQKRAGKSAFEQVFYGKKLLTLDTRLALLRRAKAGDHLAAKILTDHEERCTNLVDFSARLLGIQETEFTAYLDQCNRRLEMLGELSRPSQKMN